MKKIFIVLGVTLLAMAACTKFVEETIPADILKPSGEEAKSPVVAPAIEQIADAEHTTDSTFTVKITPASGNNFYSFAIVEGALPADAEGILTGSYVKNCVTVKLIIDEVETEVPLFGSFDASKQADTTVVAFDLIPNTTYTVYAVANNKNGTLSDIASLEITTTDQDAPVPYIIDEGKTKWQYDASNLEDGTFVVKFDDVIEFTDALKEGKANFYVTYLSANSTHDEDGYTEFDQIFTAPVPVDSLSADGKAVSIQVPERIPGAAVLVSFDAGVVKTVTKTAEGEEKELENPAISYGGYYYSSGKPKEYGLAARFKTASWKFDRPLVADENTGKLVRMPADTLIAFDDYTSAMMSLVAQNLAEPQWQKDGDGKPAKFNYVADYLAPTLYYTDAKLRQVSYPVQKGYYGAIKDSVFVALLTEEPDFGSVIGFAVDAESVEDLWGNPCEEFTTMFVDEDKVAHYGNYLYSYGFTPEDVIGTYTVSANSYFAGPSEFEMILDCDKKNNIYITKIFNIPCDEPILCDFDYDGGILTIPDWEDITTYKDGEDAGTIKTACNGADWVTLSMTEAGTLSNPSVWFGYYYSSTVSSDNSGWGNIFTTFDAVRTGGVPASVPAANPLVKKIHSGLAKR